MNGSRASQAFTVVLLLALGALSVVGWRSVAVRQRVVDAEQSLEECRRLAGRIVARRDAPETATDSQRSEEELAQRIEGWSRGAKLGAKQLVRIDPLSPRRVGDSEYLLEGADLELTDVTLGQLATLSAAVARDDPRLRVSRLRLTTPRAVAEEPSREETWRVELALTYLRHAPKSSRSR